MPALVDLLWRDHPDAPAPSRRGPRAKLLTDDVVRAALALADADGLDAVRVRDLAARLGVSPMSVYTYVNTREDLLVLVADAALGTAARPAYGRAGWRTRVTRVAAANRELLRARPWLLGITDERAAVGPGTIAKYDHELHAFDGTGLDDVARDAALTFLLDFVRASVASDRRGVPGSGPAEFWREAGPRLGVYVAPADFPLASRVGAAAGRRMRASYSPSHAYDFGLRRVLAGLEDLVADR